MVFSCFKHFCIFFNVNEHLAVPFVEFKRGGSHVGDLCFFCLHGITCRSIAGAFFSSLLGPIIAWNHLPNFKIFFKFCTFLPKFLNILPFLPFFSIFSPFFCPFSKKLHACTFEKSLWFLQSQKLNLTFSLLFVCMTDQTQMYPTFMSPLGLM